MYNSNSKTTPKHLAQLVAATYAGKLRSDMMQLGWRDLSNFDNNETGYSGRAFYNNQTHEVAIASKGTDFSKGFIPDSLDKGNVEQIAVGAMPTQAKDAYEFALSAHTKAESEHGNESLYFYLIGHSLGAVLAELTAVGFALDGKENFEAVTFDSLGSKEQAKTMMNYAVDYKVEVNTMFTQCSAPREVMEVPTVFQKLHITTYNNPTLSVPFGKFFFGIPSLNNLGEHIGVVTEIRPCASIWSCPTNFHVHKIGNMINYGFNKGTGQPYVAKNPGLSKNFYLFDAICNEISVEVDDRSTEFEVVGNIHDCVAG
jgi:hypothetical protein